MTQRMIVNLGNVQSLDMVQSLGKWQSPIEAYNHGVCPMILFLTLIFLQLNDNIVQIFGPTNSQQHMTMKVKPPNHFILIGNKTLKIAKGSLKRWTLRIIVEVKIKRTYLLVLKIEYQNDIIYCNRRICREFDI